MMPNVSIPMLCNMETIESYFIEQQYCLDDYNGLFISSRQSALNFRHRMSKPGYFSDWHVAGDATLILIRSGILRIGLRDNSYRDFAAGDVFIAQDKLPANTHFNHNIHGHTAQVIGDQQVIALHLKLSSV
ncbi:hypothetical protein [Paraglaciecola sp. MB-3u-78]|jgi:hypothetical protein|uniref:hypothetical protein n=1 Tax=Paraglaciecola sp. MB-3u-78 TaxID=2058332 RepID=UPI001E335150|nr:hypothetical protein [Paraglaciecola sp. MB-3u-78]